MRRAAIVVLGLTVLGCGPTEVPKEECPRLPGNSYAYVDVPKGATLIPVELVDPKQKKKTIWEPSLYDGTWVRIVSDDEPSRHYSDEEVAENLKFHPTLNPERRDVIIVPIQGEYMGIELKIPRRYLRLKAARD